MKIHLGADHAGFSHKQALQEYFIAQGIIPIDHGAFEVVTEDDYPDVVMPVAQAVAADSDAVGIIFGGSGQGEAMCANRVPGVRAVVYYGGQRDIITLSRRHNNANVLSIGARFMTKEEMIEMVELWLKTEFSAEEKHARRLAKF